MPRSTAFRGLDRVRRRIPQWVGNAAEEAVQDAQQEARRTNVFKDRTGRHRASIQSELDPDLSPVVRAVLRAGMEYSPFLELGTSRMSPRPHLWAAMELQIDSREAFTRELARTFRRLGR